MIYEKFAKRRNAIAHSCLRPNRTSECHELLAANGRRFRGGGRGLTFAVDLKDKRHHCRLSSKQKNPGVHGYEPLSESEGEALACWELTELYCVWKKRWVVLGR